MMLGGSVVGRKVQVGLEMGLPPKCPGINPLLGGMFLYQDLIFF